MHIDQRIQRLRSMMEKQADVAIPRLPKVEAPSPDKLFTKPPDLTKPPKLPGSANPKVEDDFDGLPDLPDVKLNGKKPNYSADLKKNDPYNLK